MRLTLAYLLALAPGLAFGFGFSDSVSATGTCSPIFQGDLDHTTVKIECGTSIPRTAVEKLEALIQQKLDTEKNLNEYINRLRGDIADWEKKYQDLQVGITAQRAETPDDPRLQQAEQALQNGEFEAAAKLLAQLAEEQEKQVEKAAAYHFKSAQAYQLAFQPQAALPHLKQAWQYRPENIEYAGSYALLLQKQNQRKQAERVYQDILDALRPLAEQDPERLPDLSKTLNNLGVLVADYPQRRAEAETLYQEALSIRRQLAKDQPAVYRPDVALTLNNLANLVAADTQRRAEAEKLYQEALSVYRQLAKDQPAVYVPYIALTLNNLGLLVAADTQRRAEAETLYQEALVIRRQLAKDQPAVYRPDVALTLNNLAILVAADTQRRAEAETLFQEALSIRRQLAKDQPAVYRPDVAATLNNLAILVAADTQRRAEAEKLYQEALSVYRQLAKDQPAVYLPYVATVLGAMGLLYLQGEDYPAALKHQQEAIGILRPLAKQHPGVFGDTLAYTLMLSSLALQKTGKAADACAALQEAADIAQSAELKEQIAGVRGEMCGK